VTTDTVCDTPEVYPQKTKGVGCSFLGIFRFVAQIEMFCDGVCLSVKVEVRPAGVLRFLLSRSRAKKEVETVRLLNIGDTKHFAQVDLGVCPRLLFGVRR
jgi:hypothetical protein